MPRLDRINVYPIKSCDGTSVDATEFTAGGGLAYDRRFVLRDTTGAVVNGKRYPALHRLRVAFVDDFRTVTLTAPERETQAFALAEGNADLDGWLSTYLERPVQLFENADGGFPDDPDCPGPTVLATASLEAVAAWFPGLSLDEVRRRFRANLEFGACEPFWEDRLFAADASPQAVDVVPFRIGDVLLDGVNPCARCPVPTRDSHTGEAYPRFAQEFGRRREEALPEWAPVTAFNHFYRLSVNTRPTVTTAGRRITVGDAVDLV